MISGFSRGVNEVFTLLECYAELIGSWSPTFRDILSGQAEREDFKNNAVF